MRDPLRHHRRHRTHLIGSSFAERLVERVADQVGSVRFVAVALFAIGGWLAVNGVVPFAEHTIKALTSGGKYDPAPWILLNLLFSFEAFFTGSLVVVAAKAQAKRDQARELAEAKHREEIAAEHSEMLDKLLDRMDENTAGGIKVILDRVDALHVEMVHNGAQAEPEIEPPAAG